MLRYSSSEDDIKVLEALDFKQFKAFKKEFFKNLKFTWFVGGHLSKSRALKLVELAMSKIGHKEMNEKEQEDRMVKLPNKSVHELVQMNPVSEDGVVNQNSAI